MEKNNPGCPFMGGTNSWDFFRLSRGCSPLHGYLLFAGITEVASVFLLKFTSRDYGVQCDLSEEIIRYTFQAIMHPVLSMNPNDFLFPNLHHTLTPPFISISIHPEGLAIHLPWLKPLATRVKRLFIEEQPRPSRQHQRCSL